MAETPAPTEINPGTPKFANAGLLSGGTFQDGIIVFEGAHHPKEAAAGEKTRKADAALRDKLKGNAAYEEAAAKLGADPDKLQLEALRKEHAPTEFSAFKTAEGEYAAVKAELKQAQAKHLGTLDHTKIAGYTPENADKVKEAVAAFQKEAKSMPGTGRWLDGLRAGKAAGGGIGNQLKHNFGGTGKLKAVFNGIGTAVGVGAIIHGLFVGKKKDEKGDPTIDRSLLVRGTEVVGGAALVVGSALRGPRGLAR